MRHRRTGALALVISLFSTAGVLVAAETPGEESNDIPGDPAVLASVQQMPATSPVIQPEPLPVPATETVGPETGLPIPRFVSMKSDRANVRRGPSKTHRIDWEFLRRGMPVEVLAEYGHWRRIRDHDGMGGWVHYALISGNRTVLVEQDMLELHYRPDPDTRVTAKLEAGVIAELGDCTLDWCELSVGGYDGWAPKTAMWGVSPDEIRE